MWETGANAGGWKGVQRRSIADNFSIVFVKGIEGDLEQNYGNFHFDWSWKSSLKTALCWVQVRRLGPDRDDSNSPFSKYAWIKSENLLLTDEWNGSNSGVTHRVCGLSRKMI